MPDEPTYINLNRREHEDRTFTESDPSHSSGGNAFSLSLRDGVRPDGSTRWYAVLHCGLPLLEELHRLTGALLAKEALQNRASA